MTNTLWQRIEEITKEGENLPEELHEAAGVKIENYEPRNFTGIGGPRTKEDERPREVELFIINHYKTHSGGNAYLMPRLLGAQYFPHPKDLPDVSSFDAIKSFLIAEINAVTQKEVMLTNDYFDDCNDLYQAVIKLNKENDKIRLFVKSVGYIQIEIELYDKETYELNGLSQLTNLDLKQDLNRIQLELEKRGN